MTNNKTRTGRRAALMAMAGGSAAALLAGRGRSEAGPVAPLNLGTTNSSGATTELKAAGTFAGLYVLTVSTDHENDTAVRGLVVADGGTGVEGSGGLRGVAGTGPIGVMGDGVVAGVRGIGGPANAVGVHGVAEQESGVGVRAENPGNGLALEALGDVSLRGVTSLRGPLRLVDPGTGTTVTVSGRDTPAGVAFTVDGPVSFKTSGISRFTKGQISRTVTGVDTPPGARILVTLNQNPGPGNALKYVKRSSDNGFTAYLLKPVTGRVEFSWFVIV